MDIIQTINNCLQAWGVGSDVAGAIDNVIALSIIIILSILADIASRRLLLPAIAHVVQRTKATWDDVVFNPKVTSRMAHIVAPFTAYLLLPLAFPDENVAGVVILQRVLLAVLQLAFINLIDALLRAVFQMFSERESMRGKPLTGLLQTLLVCTWFIGLIVVVATLIGQSPWKLVAGLGASAAVLMLVFKDSIMGFVSGIQLTANDMLKVGDWIKIPKHGADGIVTEVTLATVKVKNWDNSVTTIPPYSLVSESFNNWQAMRDSKARRIKRAIYIDMSSIRFCTDEMIARYSAIPLLQSYFSAMKEDGAEDGFPVGGIRGLTNLGVLRAYLSAYLHSLPLVRQDLHCMVRQLEPTAEGLPLELYFFIGIVDWVPYEEVQSNVFDHVLAVVPLFDLRMYQAPSGRDLRSVGARSRSTDEVTI